MIRKRHKDHERTLREEATRLGFSFAIIGGEVHHRNSLIVFASSTPSCSFAMRKVLHALRRAAGGQM